ncbi:MAG TPA: universal stress protein [Fimbriimonadaceae bacterium]|nr:universal stress protein [Fimbriimonadaceae bacterium]
MKILFATDGSAHAQFAEKLLARMRGVRGDLHVLSVSSPVPVLGLAAPPVLAPTYPEESLDLWKQLQEHAENVAREAAGRLAHAGFNVRHSAPDGDIGGTILDTIEADRTELVVVGSRGENALEALVLGSVARKLVSHAPCSVLVARPYAAMTPEESGAQLEAKAGLVGVVGVDDTPGSHKAIEWLSENGGDTFAEIATLCAEPPPVVPPGIMPSMLAMEVSRERVNADSIARKAAEALAGITPKTTPYQAHGHGAFELIKNAKEVAADLVIVGATRHGLIERFLIGSVSYEVATHAPCSVLVVRP